MTKKVERNFCSKSSHYHFLYLVENQRQVIYESDDNLHRQLFEQMEEGFLSAEVIRDRAGAIIDWRFIEVNAAIEKHLGINAAGLVGQLRSIAFPERNRWWEHMVAQVIETQQSARLQQYFEGPGRWSEIIMFPFGPERFAVLYYDITDKRRNDSNAAFQDCVVSELAKHSTAAEIMRTVGSMVGEYLDVSSCSYLDVDD